MDKSGGADLVDIHFAIFSPSISPSCHLLWEEREEFFFYKWFLKHITSDEKARKNSDIAVFEPIGAVIFTHCYTCINKPCCQSGGTIILSSWLYSCLRGTDNSFGCAFVDSICNIIETT